MQLSQASLYEQESLHNKIQLKKKTNYFKISASNLSKQQSIKASKQGGDINKFNSIVLRISHLLSNCKKLGATNNNLFRHITIMLKKSCYAYFT